MNKPSMLTEDMPAHAVNQREFQTKTESHQPVTRQQMLMEDEQDDERDEVEQPLCNGRLVRTKKSSRSR